MIFILRKKKYKRELLKLADPEKFLLSLKLEALEVERRTLHKLYAQGRFTERVLYEFESELDLQQDALEYPELYSIKSISKDGKINTRKSFRKELNKLRRFISEYKLLSKLLHINEDEIITERYSLLRARLFTSYAVIDYLNKLEGIFKQHNEIVRTIEFVKSLQNEFIENNQAQIEELTIKYPELVSAYQRKIINKLVYSK